MSQGFLHLPYRRIVIQWGLNVIFLAGLAACDGGLFPTPSQALLPCTPVPTIVTPGVIVPTETSINIYKATPDPLIADMFQYAATPTPTATFLPFTPSPIPDPNEPINRAIQQAQRNLDTRYAAFRRLVDEVKRWTDVQKIKLDDETEAYIMVTFISPELAQAVFLNNILARNENIASIRVEMEKALFQFSKREGIIFMVTVTSAKANRESPAHHTLEIPMDDMLLLNAANLEVHPQHEDQNLDQPIDPSLGPAFGYLYYPLAVDAGGACTQVLDPIFSTKIVIQTKSLKVDSKATQLTWTILYKPLLESGMPAVTPTFVPSNATQVAGLLPSRDVPSGSEQINWEEFAKFIWGQITLEIY